MQKTEEIIRSLSNISIDCISEKFSELLSSKGIENKEVLRLRLGLEDVLLYWQAYFGEEHDATISLTKKFGQTYLRVECVGQKSNPLEGLQSNLDDWSYSIIKSFGTVPVFEYENGINRVSFFVEKQKKASFLKTLLFCLLAGCAAGFAGLFLEYSVRLEIVGVYIERIISAFLSLLNVFGIPLIFLSVMNGIIGIGNINSFSKIGLKMIRYFFYFILVTLIVSIGFALLLYKPDFSSAGFAMENGKLLDIVISSVPTGLLSPLIECNAIQLIILATAFGIGILILNKNNGILVSFMTELQQLLLLFSKWVTAVIPYFITLEVIKIIWLSTDEILLDAMKTFLATSFLLLIMTILLIAAVSVRYKVSFLQISKKISKLFLIALGTDSCGASIPENYECCASELGISPRLFSIGIPIGTTVFKPATVIRLVILCVYLLKETSMSVPPYWIGRLFVLVFFISIAAPAIPNGTFLLCATLFSGLGISADVLPRVLSTDIFFDIICTAVNQIVVPLTLTLFAGKIGLLDIDILKKPWEITSQE